MDKDDKELNAIAVIMKTLSELDEGEKESALSYIIKRLDLDSNLKDNLGNLRKDFTEGKKLENIGGNEEKIAKDIRTLKEEKSPKSAIQMAVLVAYYLSRLVSTEQRKDAISTRDIDKYFEQAKYPFPKSAAVLLVDTKKAGYFEMVERGKYKLNAVGYNLAAHVMGSGNKEIARKTPSRKKKSNKR